MAIHLDSEFLSYLADCDLGAGSSPPAMSDLAGELGMSISKLREQVEVARTMGWVDIRPRIGIQVKPFSCAGALSLSMRYALALDRRYFGQIEELREVIEAAYWFQAVRALRDEDKHHLEDVIDRAWRRLKGAPIEIPHVEHRELHLTIFSRLENAFVKGFMDAYWDAYESVGLNVYSDYPYLEAVWEHHEDMVDAILRGEFEEGHRILIEHFGILHRRPERSESALHSVDELAIQSE